MTPNQISLASVGFAAFASACLLAMPHLGGLLGLAAPAPGGPRHWGRLLCNLFDGMVAGEGGKGTASGELFNDFPDHIADPMILIATGYTTTVFPWAPALGWAAGLGAVMPAYVRTLGASLGAPVDLRGPMAKQHRMAPLTFA